MIVTERPGKFKTRIEIDWNYYDPTHLDGVWKILIGKKILFTKPYEMLTMIIIITIILDVKKML